MNNYCFDVPKQKKIRLIINTDAKNEADDQFAIVHALLTPKFDIRGIIATHFGNARTAKSMEESYDEINKVLDLMKIKDSVKVVKGATKAMEDEVTPVLSEGAELIIQEALSNDPSPLYVIFLGPLTDMASAYLHNPAIESRVNVIWIGGGAYPSGGREFNLQNDINSANVVFKSKIQLWQVPRDVYVTIRVSLAELEYKVKHCGELGEYLVRQMVEVNNLNASNPQWPYGESWSLGDSPAISLLIDPHEYNFDWIPAPLITKEMAYVHNQPNRPIRVYNYVDSRFTLEDMFSKIALNYSKSLNHKDL
jgi:purine nucleosidase